MESRDMFETPEHFSLSVELLRLMHWIVEHDPEGLKKLVSRAISQMPNPTNILSDHTPETREANDAQQDIVDFLMLMEGLLFDALSEHQSKSASRHQMIPAISRIDSTVCDTNLVQGSVEKATSQMRLNPKENPRDLLMKELIKRWKPYRESMQ
jgi:hypothetical protein